MRVETNKRLIKRKTTTANYLFFITFGILVVGFFGTNYLLSSAQTNNIIAVLAAPVLLVLSLSLTFFSIRMTNTWTLKPRPEEALADGLKGLSNKSVLYHYHHSPAQHVLICPQGVFAITTRWQGGRHSVTGTEAGDVWRTQRNFIGQLLSLFRLDGLGNPSKDAEKAAAHAQKLFMNNTTEADVDVQPIIVFINPKAILELNDPHIPVVYADSKSTPNLTSYLRNLNRGKDDKGGKKSSTADFPLSDAQIDAFETATLKPQ